MPTNCGPITAAGKAVASRNATTHGVFARDIVLPSLGEDPDGYQQVQDELVAQLRPGNLLERHYVEKIAAASWRLRRLHRWQAQLFEDDTLSEDTRLDKLDKVLRHETALQRQIDTAVKMLAKDVPQLYARRAREEALDSLQLSERECLADGELDMGVAMEARNRLYQLRKSTQQAVHELSVAPLDAHAEEPAASSSPDSPPFPSVRYGGTTSTNRGGSEERTGGVLNAGGVPNSENCRNEPAAPKRSYRTLPRRGLRLTTSSPAPPLLGAGGPSSLNHP